MDLWIVNHYAGGPTNGMGFRHFYLARYLKKHGIHPTIISASFTHLYQEPAEVPEDFLITEEEEIRRVYIRTRHYFENNYRRFLNTLDFARGVKKLSRQDALPRPDIILGSSPHLSGAIAALRLAQGWGIPFYFEVRDLWPLSLVDVGSMSRFHPLVWHMYRLERRLLRAAHRLVSVLPLAKEYFVRRGLDPAKFFYLPNGVEPLEVKSKDAACPLAEELRQHVQKGEFAIVYAGHHGQVNGLDTLLGAVAILKRQGRKEIHAYLVGSGPEKPHLQKKAVQHRLANVHFADKVSRKQITAILTEAGACFIGLKKGSAFRFGVCPNKLLEYMLAGRPIIYAINSGNHPVVEAGCGVEVAPESPAELAAAMILMSEKTGEELTTMGGRGREYVLRHHRYETLGAQLADLVRTDLLSSRG